MKFFSSTCGRTLYKDLVRNVIKDGVPRTSRGRSTFDLGPTIVELTEPWNALPIDVGRNLNTSIAAVEAIQLIAGHPRHDLMRRASPVFESLVESNGNFYGAYGARIGDQLHYAFDKIRKDPGTRQAVVTLWDPTLDNEPGKKDYPCTVGFNFSIENNRLCMNVVMRSNDVWLGVPYDWFQFTQLQITMARVLGIAPGSYTHTAWSTHIYLDDVGRAEMMLKKNHYSTGSAIKTHRLINGIDGIGYANDAQDWSDISKRAYDILNKTENPFKGISDVMTESEKWYASQLEKLRG